MKLTEAEKAERILEALENSKVPISWHCIDAPELIRTIARELRKMEREEVNA